MAREKERMRERRKGERTVKYETLIGGLQKVHPLYLPPY